MIPLIHNNLCPAILDFELVNLQTLYPKVLTQVILKNKYETTMLSQLWIIIFLNGPSLSLLRHVRAVYELF